MAETVGAMQGVELYAVASRDKAKAEAFGSKYGAEKAYGSYEALAADDGVELVYVASPHSHHAQHATLCVQYGRPVLCEKAFTANAKEAEALLDLAKREGVFITEAMWTRYMPLAKTFAELVRSGAIGKPTMLTAALGFPGAELPRMVEPALAGGALLDVGIYPITMASLAFGGEIKEVVSQVQLMESGVDAYNAMLLHYADGAIASLASSVLHRYPERWAVYGDGGRMEVQGIPNLSTICVLDHDGNETAVYEAPPQISGYEYEVDACLKALREGRLECEEMPHAETMRIMRLMDSLRADWGVRYPFE